MLKKKFEFPFEFDDFQKEAIEYIEKGHSVVVTAPTGAGKTVIAENAINIAIEKGKRLFYTTPLKALSNQKFRDFKATLGEENVGLLTGDTSINRNASVVVMTTEVYRNILYGTNFGKVDDNLKDVMFVVLDECHYMNDEARGTVWEESIIYSPQNIQLIALSATVANSKELTSWINTVHHDTSLVDSDFRPVPLRHFYFVEDQLLPMLAPGGRVNKKAKGLYYSKVKAKRGKKRPRKTPVPLVKILEQKEMLPAIYFLFSRKQCDSFMEECAQLSLLTDFEKKRMQKIVDDFILDNPIIGKNRQLELIYSGVASHHAGLLPSWKALVETLFQEGLIKVVFATETLAAGINMPARTTVISDISKRADHGHRNLTPSEFLQMSGRAGRRGMDKVGYVITSASSFHDPSEVAMLVKAPADPLYSQFKPTYSMVLNLLQRFEIEQARQLIFSSFGYFTSNARLAPLYDREAEILDHLDELQNAMCPSHLTQEDFINYRKLKEKYVQIKRLYKILKQQALNTGRPDAPEVREYQLKYQDIQQDLKSYPCYYCDNYKRHIKSTETVKRLEKKLGELQKEIKHEKDLYWNQFINLVDVLTEFGYLEDNYPTELGLIASTMRCDNELYMVEIINSGILDNLSAAQLAAVLCAMISEEPRGNTLTAGPIPSKKIREAIRNIHTEIRKINSIQKRKNVAMDASLSAHFSGIVEEWASMADWDTLVEETNLAEGDIVRTLKRTVDILRQVINAPYINPELTNRAKEAFDAINREPVKEDV